MKNGQQFHVMILLFYSLSALMNEGERGEYCYKHERERG